MEDFGNENSQFSLCEVCRSTRHHTAAHSRLNDAAPELLGMLRDIAEWCERYDGDVTEHGKHVIHAIAVNGISKATGGLF
jgi:hypothetical protein